MDTAQTTQTIQKQIDRMKESINLMDNFSQDGFSRIEAIARLALLAMETPEGQRDVEVYATAFEAIRAIACDMENLINCEAENSGDHYQNLPRRLRTAAHSAARAKQQEGGAA
ncbi:MAG TPA: hypothetical protein VFY31_07210 [Macromonas sp.]|nr:hypothetical protein [Macromonas sp.]